LTGHQLLKDIADKHNRNGPDACGINTLLLLHNNYLRCLIQAPAAATASIRQEPSCSLR
jgi:hypothetical protein